MDIRLRHSRGETMLMREEKDAVLETRQKRFLKICQLPALCLKSPLVCDLIAKRKNRNPHLCSQNAYIKSGLNQESKIVSDKLALLKNYQNKLDY